MVGWLINLKGFGRKWLWPNQSTILAFGWSNWEKPQKTSVRIARVLAEIQIEHLSSISLEVTAKPIRLVSSLHAGYCLYCTVKKLRFLESVLQLNYTSAPGSSLYLIQLPLLASFPFYMDQWTKNLQSLLIVLYLNFNFQVVLYLKTHIISWSLTSVSL